MRRLLLYIATPLLAASAGACGSGSEIVSVCTEIGCDSGIEVVLEQPPEGSYRVEASVNSAGARYVFECSAGEACPERIFFAEFTPYRVFIDVTSAAGTERYEVVPTYTEHQPNGPDCPPLCRNAVVRLPSDRLGD